MHDVKMRGICLNWKVAAGLAAVGLGIWVLAPGLFAAAGPLLVVAACPLSMVVMMWAMRGSAQEGSACAMPAQQAREPQTVGQPAQFAASREAQLAELKAELVRTQAQQEAIARRIAELELADAPAVREAEAVAQRAESRGGA